MSQVKDSAVAVTVDQALSLKIPDVDPFPFSNDEIDVCH
jgi:hypothetical protein